MSRPVASTMYALLTRSTADSRSHITGPPESPGQSLAVASPWGNWNLRFCPLPIDVFLRVQP
ncbi:MAG: hypothetical protein U0326_26420 [Polyangiales bacterium]